VSKNLTQRDAQFVWHPYSQHGFGIEPLPVARAKGAYLELATGERALDGISSWWVNIHGHGHPAIAEAIARQASVLDHVLFAGFTHEPGVELAHALIDLVHSSGLSYLKKVFYSDNGSTAVEVALKIAYQFHQNHGNPKRRRFLALQGGYHGDTLGAMAASDPDGYHSLFRPLLPEFDSIRPGSIEDLKRCLDLYPDEYAAFIFEPLLQGAGGMRIYSPEYLRDAIALCRSKGVLSIADEVFTGFYRTGTCFAMEQVGVSPDLLCLSKGLTGGVLPLAATLVTEELFEAFRSRQMRDAFLHGHSYTANPIACAAALASLKILATEETRESIARIVTETHRLVASLSSRNGIHSVRSIGTVGAFELRQAPDYFGGDFGPNLMKRAISRGVLLRPLGTTLYAVPPYCMNTSELETIYTVMKELNDE
jgi:adenosylmethionine-8-amino-7-oxononanoate aminotransferase